MLTDAWKMGCSEESLLRLCHKVLLQVPNMASRFSQAPFHLLPAGDCDAPAPCIRYSVRGGMRSGKSQSPLGLQHPPLLSSRRMQDFMCCCVDGAVNILLAHKELRMRCWDGGSGWVGAG